MSNRKHDQRFDDGALVRSDFRDAGHRSGTPHKTAQLCAQIQRALELCLLGDCADPAFADVEVVAVEPTREPRRLKVLFEAGAAELARERLEAARGLLVDAAVQAIHRRRAPELVFEVRARQ